MFESIETLGLKCSYFVLLAQDDTNLLFYFDICYSTVYVLSHVSKTNPDLATTH